MSWRAELRAPFDSLFFQASSVCNMFLSAVTQELDNACSRIAAGRAAARELSQLVEGFGLKEGEFRLLWALLTGETPPHQSKLAELLGCSPAQVSGIVERQQLRGNIARRAALGDRRRQVWQITPQGRALLEKVVAAKTASGPVLSVRRDSA